MHHQTPTRPNVRQRIAKDAQVKVAHAGHWRYNWAREVVGFAICSLGFLAFMRYLAPVIINGR